MGTGTWAAGGTEGITFSLQNMNNLQTAGPCLDLLPAPVRRRGLCRTGAKLRIPSAELLLFSFGTSRHYGILQLHSRYTVL